MTEMSVYVRIIRFIASKSIILTATTLMVSVVVA
jgi:hypothetical protein